MNQAAGTVALLNGVLRKTAFKMDVPKYESSYLRAMTFVYHLYHVHHKRNKHRLYKCMSFLWSVYGAEMVIAD